MKSEGLLSDARSVHFSLFCSGLDSVFFTIMFLWLVKTKLDSAFIFLHLEN